METEKRGKTCKEKCTERATHRQRITGGQSSILSGSLLWEIRMPLSVISSGRSYKMYHSVFLQNLIGLPHAEGYVSCCMTHLSDRYLSRGIWCWEKRAEKHDDAREAQSGSINRYRRKAQFKVTLVMIEIPGISGFTGAGILRCNTGKRT